MSAQEFNLGRRSSNESSANAKATHFLASGKDSQSFESNGRRSLFEDAVPETRILNNHVTGYDDMCLSPLAYEGRCRSLASFVAEAGSCNNE